MKHILCLLLMILGMSCVNKQDLAFPKEEHLQLSSVQIKDIIAPEFLTVAGNYLYVASSTSDDMLHAYRLNDLSHAWSGGKKGQGPEEFQSFPMFCESETDDLYIWGETAISVNQYQVGSDGSLQSKRKYTLPQYDSFNQLHVTKDSLLLYNAFPNQMAIKGLPLSPIQKEWEMIIGEDVKDQFLNEDRGYMAVNGTHLLYAYLFKNRIDIYDRKTKQLQARIEGEYNKQKPSRGSENKEYYIGIYAGKQYFYALGNDYQEQLFMLDIFSYEGKPLVRCYLDQSVHLFTIDEKGKQLLGFNFQDEDHFLRVSLPIG